MGLREWSLCDSCASPPSPEMLKMQNGYSRNIILTLLLATAELLFSFCLQVVQVRVPLSGGGVGRSLHHSSVTSVFYRSLQKPALLESKNNSSISDPKLILRKVSLQPLLCHFCLSRVQSSWSMCSDRFSPVPLIILHSTDCIIQQIVTFRGVGYLFDDMVTFEDIIRNN